MVTKEEEEGKTQDVYTIKIDSDAAQPTEPSAAVKSPKPISSLETMVHLLKSNIGSSIYSIPFAFQESGLWFGLFGLSAMAIISTHCMQMLVRVAETLKRRNGDLSVNYANVGETVCLTASKPFRKFAPFARILINSFIVVTQYGFCCVYLNFMSSNLMQVIDHFYPDLKWDVRIYMCILTVPLIFLNWVRNLKLLAPVSMIGNVLQVFNIVVVFYYSCQDLPSTGSLPAIGHLSDMPLFFATSLFTFEGISLVLPLQKDMRSPHKFGGLMGLLNTAMAIVCLIYIGVGFFGYLKYGSDIQPTITLNLPPDEILAIMVKLSTVFAVGASYAMQFYVPIPIILPTISKYLSFIGSDFLIEYIYRTLMVLVVLGLSAAIPELDLVISLVGALGCSFLAVIFPTVLEMILHWETSSKLIFSKNCCIILIGIVGCVSGAYTTIIQF